MTIQIGKITSILKKNLNKKAWEIPGLIFGGGKTRIMNLTKIGKMDGILAQEYWNEIGSKKDFEDPVYLDKLSKLLSLNAQIVEYGCGYGRMMRILKNGGYQNLIGFDFAPNMIRRGKKENPDLDLRLLEKSGVIPCADESLDAVVMSTVLCCLVDKKEASQLMREILRVLKKKGILYVTDFLVCEHPRYREKYAQGMEKFGEWGIYTTTENLTVRHYTARAIMNLLKDFAVEWFEQFDFKTMNQHPARTFHCIARKTCNIQCEL